MSNERKLLVYRDSNLIKEFPLTGDSMIVGREDSCDIVLEADSVSRLHAKIVIQEATIYLENQSSTGQLFVESKQVEFAEWSENHEAKIGPFILKWAHGEAQKTDDHQAQAPASKDVEQQASDETSEPESGEPASNFGFANNWADPIGNPDSDALSLMKPSEDSPDSDSEDVVSADDQNNETPDLIFAEDDVQDLAVDTNESTKITDSDAIGLLKITQGETIGREIKLDQGFQWIVGRSTKCHIKIDNGKLSRQHFKIVKVSGRYRLQDLGSANGTRLNGIAVTDAPLSPFDTIVAGPVEFQFLVAQSHMENVPVISEEPFGAHESTQFAPPPMIYNGDGGGNPFEHVGNASSSHTNSESNPYAQSPGNTSVGNSSAESPKSLSGKAKVWWGSLPKNKKLLYAGALTVMIGVLLMPSTDNPAETTGANPLAGATANSAQSTSAAPPDSLAAESRANDISPEFYLLTAEERRKVEDAYAKAQRARNASDWKEAVAQSKEVTKYVDKYKDITDILAESQTHFNEVILGAVTKNLKNSLDADAQVQEQVALFIEAGKKAISEGRWPDAQDQCAKAVSLDPKNEDANNCYAAAYGQDASYVANNAPAEIPLPNDPNLELQAQLERDLESKKQTYQAAQSLEQASNFDKALESYKALLAQVDKEIDGINLPGRYPASVSTTYAEKNTDLKMQVEQRIKDINFQYETDFRSQLIDAEQLIANQDYVRARETYDRILNAAPNFQDVRTKRAELYRRMISEARGIYHEALIYESVGDLQAAVDKYGQTKRLLAGIIHPTADEYFRKANTKLRTLVP